ncbi:hypothetical protein [Rhizobium leguminosarum]|uniref:hypothetical protein n=1 Tax=Rhizobium leguminosarum TaxID=384 RepID=UPI001FDF2741|nr:hypothetical protein [Rhizobium leguminosarum]
MQFSTKFIAFQPWLRALVESLGIAAPVRHPSAVSKMHIRGSHRNEAGWRLYDKRYWPGDKFSDHLTFALRHEDIDLVILKRIFQAISKAEAEAFVKEAPTGVPNRRAWFLFELLTGETLDVPEPPAMAAVDLLDPKAYFTGKPVLSRRHRVRDNLLGTGDFIPIIRRTPALVALSDSRLAEKARETVGRTGAHLVHARPASCCWPIVAQAFRSRARALRATGWSAGDAPSCRRVNSR